MQQISENKNPDGTVEVYAPRLVDRLMADGCYPVRRLKNGRYLFHKTETVWEHIKAYTRERRQQG